MTDLVPYSSPRTEVVRADLREMATDSWTDVVGDMAKLASYVCNTEFVPKDLRGSPEKCTAAFMVSRELGLPPMTGLAGIHVINGRTGISAELMRGLVEQAGHELEFIVADMSRCVIRGRRKGRQEWTEASYTMADATRAGDDKKNPNYRSRPAEMLMARATTRLCRMIFADAIHGMRSVEELQDMAGTEVVEVSPPQAAAAPASVSRQARRGTAAGKNDGGGGGGADAGEGSADVDQPGSPGAGDDTPPSPPPSRRRVQLPAPRAAASDRIQTQQGRDEVMAENQAEADKIRENEAKQAEIRELSEQRRRDKAEPSEPPPDPQAEQPSDESPMISASQRTAIMARCTGLEISDRDQRLGYLSEIVGRELDSANDLTRLEAMTVLELLEKAKNRDSFEAAVAMIAEQRNSSDA